jgi:hypothetical protein
VFVLPAGVRPVKHNRFRSHRSRACAPRRARALLFAGARATARTPRRCDPPPRRSRRGPARSRARTALLYASADVVLNVSH